MSMLSQKEQNLPHDRPNFSLDFVTHYSEKGKPYSLALSIAPISGIYTVSILLFSYSAKNPDEAELDEALQDVVRV